LPEDPETGSVSEIFGSERPEWQDEVNELVYGQLSSEQIEATREALIGWYRRSRAPDVPLYVTPDGDLLSSRRLAEELAGQTVLGQSYLEIFLAGVLTDRGPLEPSDRPIDQYRLGGLEPAERVDRVLGMLSGEGGETWPFF
jgi:hypothetical protein